MKRNHYELEQDKFYIKRILKFFEHDFNPPKEENKTDVEFLEKYKVKELFLKIISRFDPELHSPHRKKLLFQSIDKWNENNTTEKIELKDLTDKYYIIQSEHFAILNPYLLRRTDIPNLIYKFYESLDKKAIIYYPFFYGNHIEEAIKEMYYGDNFNIKDLMNDEGDLFDAIFHNYKGMGKLFKETLLGFLIGISYSEWKENINKYFSLLVALSSMELNLATAINSIGSYKRDQLKRYAFKVLKDKNEILEFEKTNFLQRLLYAPYEITGIDIYKPPEGSSLVPFIEETVEEKNLFKKIESIEDWVYNSYENRNLFQNIFQDVEFILWNFEFALAEWEEILKSCNSNYYKMELFNTLSLKKDKWTEYNNLILFPYIIHQLFNSSTNINLIKENELDLIEIKFKIAKYFIDSIAESKEENLIILLDLFLLLPASQSKFEYDYQYEVKKKLRDYIIEIFSGIKSKIVFNLVLDKINYQLDTIRDFSAFDIFSGYWEYSGELKNIIINHYHKILDEKIFTDHYYDIDGKENLFKAISELNKDELKAIIDKYDFITFYEKEAEKSESVYIEGAKLRFHLGILIEYALNNEKHRNEISEYIFKTYKSIIKIESEVFEPLNWDEIVYDTFSFNRNFNENQLLSIILIDLLSLKDRDFITKFFNEIKDYLSFTELSFYQRKFPNIIEIKDFNLSSSFPKDLTFTGLGQAQVEAYLLLKNNLPDKAIKYVDYIESLGGEYSSKEIKEIKFRAFLLMNNYDNAEITLRTIPGVIDNLFGLFYYFKKDYANSVKSFEKYKRLHRFLTKEDTINFSAALILNNQPEDAIKLLVDIKEENPDEYFLFYNLGIAYKEIDKYQSLVYLNYAKKIKPDLTGAKLEFYNSLNNLIPDFVKVLEELSSEPDFINKLMTEFNAQSSDVLKITAQLNIDNTEKRIVTEIYSALEERAFDPIRLETTKETELSNDIKGLLKASLKDENIIIEREAPGGRSKKTVGEIDLFIYRHPDEIIAVGENKEWSPEKFQDQLKQLLGYIRENRGFAFTIIFNKKVRLETVRKERGKILKEFFVEIDGEKYFNIIRPIYDASIYVNKVKDVLLTVHKDGESTLRIYHFIINAYDKEKKEAAKQARNKKSQA